MNQNPSPFPKHDCFENSPPYFYGKTLCGMGGGPTRAAKKQSEVTCKSCLMIRNKRNLKEREGLYEGGLGI